MSERAGSTAQFRRLAGVGLAVLVAVCAVVGCSSSKGGGATSSSSNSAGASGSITVQVQTGGEKEFANFIQVFNKQYPNVKVNTVSVSQEAKLGPNLQVLSSSNPPDVGIVPTNTQVYTRLMQAHQLLPLTDVWKADNLDTAYGGIAGTLKSAGTPYVVNYHQVFYCVVYYSKDAFQKAGIAAPANHRIASVPDLIDMATKLRANRYQGLAYGAADNYETAWQIDAFLQTSADPGQLANYLSSWQSSVPVQDNYTDAPFTNALGAIQSLAKNKVYQDGYLGQKVAPAEALFVQKKVGMLLDGSWSPSALKDQGLNFDIDWALLPTLDPSRQNKLTSYNGDTLAIPTKAKHAALAKLFLESIVSPEGQATVIKTGNLPSVNTVPATAYSDLPPIVQDELADAKANGSLVGWTSAVPGGLGQQFTDPIAQEMLQGKLTAPAVAAKVQDQLQKTRTGN
jgi:raffinose/stachyose/melibiose transport system substrate-binding protein